ncbi:alpha/beta hydrolase [Tessaracoccus oleiagri]|uniref:Lysophospholipase, alpha-beta hydrolase superfamily n=1 Tax=Tessaracoccus oleiagri TaxID=686624 RepID=A0A1G9HA64_9ACTN|nr:alpha/beta hydrolase [Tessaracoccus oleiagri]SDL09674.1 Lysophospholipase, alpha-beta hydrolase superfamily [Tessaracoccus oleiagri]
MDEQTITLRTNDGINLHVYRWAPDDQPKAAVQVHHGLAEHAGRYRRLAEALTAAGYLVYAPDQRASGRSAAGDYGNWGPDGWAGWVDDYALLNARIRADNPQLDVALIGHSMGSFGAQQYLLEHSAEVASVVLIGTGDVVDLVPLLTAEGPADLSAFNASFEHRTGFEWLSRDEAEVDKYVADEASGWSAPLPADLKSLLHAAEPAALEGIREDLPILLLSGDRDPVGGDLGEGVERTAARYREAGLRDVIVKLYPEARHEVLNEINRDEVTADVVDFLDRTVGYPQQ